MVEFVLSSPDVYRLLVTLCTDFRSIGQVLNPGKEAAGTGILEEGLDEQQVTNAQVKQLLAEACGMQPFAYVASSHDLSAERWLLYYAFTVHRPHAGYSVLHAGPAFGKIVDRLCKLSKRSQGTLPFGQVIGGLGTLLMTAAHGLAARDPKTAAFLASRLWPGAKLSQKSLVFQQGPNVTADGAIEFCRDCPDATVRDGKLVPVCMVDALDGANRNHLLRC